MLTFFRYIEVYVTFAFLDCVCRNEDFVQSRFVRDGPLEKLLGGWGEWGIFEPQEFFFVIKFVA